MIECPECHRRFPESVLLPLRCGCGMLCDVDRNWVRNEIKKPVIPLNGPGTELKRIFVELGVKPKEDCGCDSLAAEMNLWGVEGCQDRRAEILQRLEEGYEISSLAERATAGILAVAKFYPKTLAGLLGLAIQRAAKVRQQSSPG